MIKIEKLSVNFIKFQALDQVELDAIFYRNINSKSIVISTHGMTSNCFKDRDKYINNVLQDINVDYFVYNNRGADLARYVYVTHKDGTKEKMIAGTSYEDPLDGYYDIGGAIKFLVELGYQNIYLQGHSLGSTKTLYTYLKMQKLESPYLKNIKGILLLSLVDIPGIVKYYLANNENGANYLEYALEKEKYGKKDEIMPKEAFIHPLSVKTFLRYAKYNEEIDFAKYSMENNNFPELNRIHIPLFMRWGNNKELILQKANDLVTLLNEKIINDEKDINFINGADHSYHGYEEELAEEILNFINHIEEKNYGKGRI